MEEVVRRGEEKHAVEGKDSWNFLGRAIEGDKGLGCRVGRAFKYCTEDILAREIRGVGRTDEASTENSERSHTIKDKVSSTVRYRMRRGGGDTVKKADRR
jgi:hypothetical protein